MGIVGGLSKAPEFFGRGSRLLSLKIKGARPLCFINVNIGLDLIILCINQAS